MRHDPERTAQAYARAALGKDQEYLIMLTW